MPRRFVVMPCQSIAEGDVRYAVWVLDSQETTRLLHYLELAQEVRQHAPVKTIIFAPAGITITFTTWEPFCDIAATLNLEGHLVFQELLISTTSIVPLEDLELVVDVARQTIQARGREGCWGVITTPPLTRDVLAP